MTCNTTALSTPKTSDMNGVAKKKPITRNRETLTCSSCRSRKLKCDKALPCGSCVKRGDGESCAYATNSGRKEQTETSRSDRAEARLQHLEQLVQEFVQSTTSASTAEHEANGHENISTNGNSTYAGATHYSAILEDIEDLRQVLSEETDLGDSPSTNEAIAAETDVVFGGTPRLPLSTILSKFLPPRIEVDRRVAAYFRAVAIAAPFIHIGQFMRQYEDFWRDPSATNPLWTSILFSICGVSKSIGQAGSLDLERHENGYNFSLAAAHCLAIGRYSRPQRFAVEALGLFIQSRVVDTLDPSRDLGILMGTLIQLAYTMGYHRDPTHLPPFEGEMRRRAWSYCLQIDLLISFQLGLPNNVQFGSWDTKIPSNLEDADFEESCIVLPAPRPDDQPTRITFYTAKHMLMTVFDKILKHALSTRPNSEAELVELDTELRSTYTSLPSTFRHKTLPSQLADPKDLVVTRKCVTLMFNKCLCVLHRKHVPTGRKESIRYCHEAATILVESFLELYPELKVGGQFYGDRWLLGSITWNDWLLGVMVLGLVVCQGGGEEKKEEILGLLRRSLRVCEENLEVSVGARRTRRLLKALLAKVDQTPATTTNGTHNSASTETVPGDDQFQLWNDSWTNNVFDTQEWNFLSEYLDMDFDMQ